MDGMETNQDELPLPSFQTEARRKRGKYEKTCMVCGGSFLVPKPQLHQKTCSMRCYGVTQRIYTPKVCLHCGGVAAVDNGNPRIYCSRACLMAHRQKENHPRWIQARIRMCVVCGKEAKNVKGSKNPTCSMECWQKHLSVTGAKHRVAVGSIRKTRQGHWMIKRDRGDWYWLHRHVVEQHLGRPLESAEVVHHIDGDKDNNAISNLFLTDQSGHMRAHKEAEKVGMLVVSGKFRLESAYEHPVEAME